MIPVVRTVVPGQEIFWRSSPFIHLGERASTPGIRALVSLSNQGWVIPDTRHLRRTLALITIKYIFFASSMDAPTHGTLLRWLEKKRSKKVLWKKAPRTNTRTGREREMLWRWLEKLGRMAGMLLALDGDFRVHRCALARVEGRKIVFRRRVFF